MAGEAIFIGYRRDDTADVAGRIYDAMALRFGKGRVFKDVDNIGPGVHFGDYIKSVLPRCRVALMLIGPHWLESKDEDGRRRLDDEHDWVRIEIETALSTPDVLTVPVLVNGARMPRASEVPDSLRPLLHRNAAIIRRDPDFHDDVERLAIALRASVNTGILDLSKIGGQSSSAGSAARARSTSRAPMMIAAALALVAAGYGAWRFLPSAFSPPLVEQVDEGASKYDAAPGASEFAAPPTPADSAPDVAQEPPAQQQTTADTVTEPSVEAQNEAPSRQLERSASRTLNGEWRRLPNSRCWPFLSFSGAREEWSLRGSSDRTTWTNVTVSSFRVTSSDPLIVRVDHTDNIRIVFTLSGDTLNMASSDGQDCNYVRLPEVRPAN